MINTNPFKDFENFQTARNTCFRSFIKKYDTSKDVDESLDKALSTAKYIKQKKLDLTHNHYKGLQGEIIFFGKNFETFDLDPVMEIGKVNADFRSQITNQYFDVSTNLDYKDAGDYIRNDTRECLIAFVDIKSKEIELIPTSFPPCPECGMDLHYVYLMDDKSKSESEIGIDYPNQDLIQYCHNCDYFNEVDKSFYYLFSPKSDLEIKFGTDSENTPQAQIYLKNEWAKISNLARKNFDVFISAVTCPESEMGLTKHDLYEINKPKWIHPILDLNIKPDRNIYFPNERVRY